MYIMEAWSRCAKATPKEIRRKGYPGRASVGLFRTFSCGREVKVFTHTQSLHKQLRPLLPPAPSTRSVFSAKERRPDEAGGLGDCGQDASCHQGRHGLLRLLLRTLAAAYKTHEIDQVQREGNDHNEDPCNVELEDTQNE